MDNKTVINPACSAEPVPAPAGPWWLWSGFSFLRWLREPGKKQRKINGSVWEQLWETLWWQKRLGPGSLSEVWGLLKASSGLPWWLSGKESACNAGDLGLIPGSGRSPGEGMATHSSILAWRIPWTEEPGGLQSIGLQRVRHDWVTNPCFHFLQVYPLNVL